MAQHDILPTPVEMVRHLDRFVRGQARAKQDVAMAVYNHYLSQAYRAREGRDLGRHHLLMIGPTGVGKTYLVKTLAEFLGVPMGFASAAGLAEAGYVGNSVETIISTLVQRAGGDPRKAERGIVFIDEIDKIKRGDGGFRDVSGEGVQNALLTLLDGRISSGTNTLTHAAVDTSRLLFICAGAFVGLNEMVDARLGTGTRRIGFRHRPEEKVAALSDRPIYTSLCQVQTGDLVKFGMIPEFVGRFATLSVLHELSRTDLKAIIQEDVERSPLRLQQDLAAIHGLQLVVMDDALDAMADEATALGTGARGLTRLIGRSVDSVEAQWSELAERGVTRVVINRRCIEKGRKPRLEKGIRMIPRIDKELRHEAVADLPPSPQPVQPGQDASGAPLPVGVSDTRGWSQEQIYNELERLKRENLKWNETTGGPRKWWSAFEDENKHRPALILRLAEELKIRTADITEFFMAYVYSNTDNIQANLHFLDYTRLKKKEDDDKRKKK